MYYIRYDELVTDLHYSNIIGFYSDELHKNNIPNNVIAITEESYKIYSKCPHKYRIDNSTVLDVLIDENEEFNRFILNLKRTRDEKIKEIEWLRFRHLDEIELNIETTLTQDRYKDLLIYIQNLRNIPAQYKTIEEVTWPTLNI